MSKHYKNLEEMNGFSSSSNVKGNEKPKQRKEKVEPINPLSDKNMVDNALRPPRIEFDPLYAQKTEHERTALKKVKYNFKKYGNVSEFKHEVRQTKSKFNVIFK